MELLQFVCELCIRLVEQTFLRHQRAKPIENDLLVGIILSNFPHNTRQTLYAHVTRGDTHIHADANGDVASITSVADISFVIKKFPLFTCSTRCECVCECVSSCCACKLPALLYSVRRQRGLSVLHKVELGRTVFLV